MALMTGPRPGLNFTIQYPNQAGGNNPLPQPVTPDQTKLQDLATRLLNQTPKPLERPFISCGPTEDLVADISWIIRTFMDPPIMLDSVAVEVLGVTTAENLFQGAWAATLAFARFIKAQGIGDRDGMIEGAIDGVRGVSQSAAGLIFLGYRFTQGAADVLKVNTGMYAPTMLGQATFALGMLGNAFYGAFYSMIAAWGSWGLYKDFEFSNAMHAAGANPIEQFGFLNERTVVNSKDHWLGLQNKSELKPKFKEEALSQFADLLKESGVFEKGSRTEEQVKGIVESVFAALDEETKGRVKQTYASALGLTLEEVGDLDLLQLIGFALLEGKRQRTLDAQVGRVTNIECVQAIKKAAARGLKERLGAEEDPLVKASAVREFDQIKEKITFENNKQKIINTALVAIGVIGLISTAAGFLAFPPGWALILLTVSTALVAFGMLAVDTYFMVDGWNKGMPGRNDLNYHFVIGGILVAAFTISMAVTLYFGLPLLPLILAGVIAHLGLTVCIVSGYMAWQKEKKWIENHPDLKTFAASLTSPDKACDEKIIALFKKLPKADRQAVRKKMTDHQHDLGFQLPKYKSVDLDVNFGWKYLNRLTAELQNAEQFNEDYSLIVKAMKKTANSLWAENTNSAMSMHGLLEAARIYKEAVGQVREITDEEGRLAAFNRAKQDFNGCLELMKLKVDAYKQLQTNIWFIAKRQHSQADLKGVINAVIEDRTSANLAEKDKARILFDHIREAFPRLSNSSNVA